MAPRSSTRSIPILLLCVALLGVSAVAVACGPSAAPDGGASPTPPASQGATVAPSPAVPSPSLAGRDAPPEAVLAADGGDPVTGQLGTFVWFDTGSDAPWLPGAPLRVGAREPLTVRLVPDGAIEAWNARYAPAAAQGQDGAKALGQGAGSVAFGAPEAGDWTLEVSITFAGGAGEAAYFWRLEVE
jgi:hypothetical protein